ncbi:MAG TPA: NUDIX hydrolase [Patescibacteria group bacterium]|nr:NUDIX hydrolase [Patescibacteria group bacterium]
MKKPIKVIRSRIVYQNPWMKVREDVVEFPNGKRGIYGLVEKDDFSLIIPFDGKKFYLVDQYRHATKKRMLEFPSGNAMASEHKMVQSAKRELKEETGFSASSWQYIGKIWLAPGHHTQAAHIFLAQTLRKGKNHLDEEESDLKVKAYTRKKLYDLIQTGKLSDGPAVAALHLLHIKHPHLF